MNEENNSPKSTTIKSNAHDHAHTHSHGSVGKNLLITIVLNFGITAFQIVGFFISGSLSLLSDALHNFTDVFSLVISWIADRISKKQHSLKATFGYKRSEVLAAFINTVTLFVVAAYLIIEAIERILEPQFIEIDATWIIWGTLVSIVGNFLSVLVLHAQAKDNINVKSSYVHLLSDLFTSIAVLIGGIIMYYYNFYWLDAVLSIGIAVYLLILSIQLLRKTLNILMQFSPIDITKQDINQIVSRFEEVENIHHLHIWEITIGRTMMMAHVDFSKNMDLKAANKIMIQLVQIFKEEYQIFEITLQPEFEYADDKSLIVKRRDE